MSLPFKIFNGLKLPHFRKGAKRPSALIAEDIDKHVQVLNAALDPRVVLGTEMRFIWSDSGLTLVLDKNKLSGAGTATRMRIKSIGGDYWVCRTWDGTSEGAADVYVAKPTHLRTSRTSEVLVNDTDTITVSYSYATNTKRTLTVTASSGGFTYNTETHFVRPHVHIGDNVNGAAYYSEIWALVTQSNTGVVPGGQPQCDFIDLNLDQREWVQLPIDPTP